MRFVNVFIIYFLRVTRIATGNISDEKALPYNENHLEANPFLSATLSTTIEYNSEISNLPSASPFYLHFDSTRKQIFSTTLTKFLTKIFVDQQVYDLKILNVNIFDDHIINDGTNEQQQQEQELKGTRRSYTGQKALVFSMVLSAEYTNESQIGTITDLNFSNMIAHVCHKFQSHLVDYMQGTGDPYFMEVESIVVDKFQNMNDEEVQKIQYLVLGMPSAKVHFASILAIVVGGILFIVLTIASFKLHGRAKLLRAGRLDAEKSRTTSTATITSTNSSRIGKERYDFFLDDNSFNPIENSSGYNVRSLYDGGRDSQETVGLNSRMSASPMWPESSPPGKHISYTDELRYLPKQHVFAPPGKIGVAIDVLNGQPVVHKVRRGSPLEHMLQKNDIIVAIDEEDTGCLSAADVTSLMAKRIDRVRKITFVRRNCQSVMNI